MDEIINIATGSVNPDGIAETGRSDTTLQEIKDLVLQLPGRMATELASALVHLHKTQPEPPRISPPSG